MTNFTENNEPFLRKIGSIFTTAICQLFENRRLFFWTLIEALLLLILIPGLFIGILYCILITIDYDFNLAFLIWIALGILIVFIPLNYWTNFINLEELEAFKNRWLTPLERSNFTILSQLLEIRLASFRVPVISGLILFYLPIISEFSPASKFLKNLFVIDSLPQEVMVITAVLVVTFNLTSLIKNIKKTTSSDDSQIDDLDKRNSLLSHSIQGIWTFFLSLPTLWVLWMNRTPDVDFIISISWSIPFLFLFFILATFYAKAPIIQSTQGFFGKPIKSVWKVWFTEIVLGLILYLSIIGLNWPQSNGDIPISSIGYNFQAPTLLYALLIIWIFTLVLGILTYSFDKIAWPVSLIIILFVGVSYGAFTVDHYFQLKDSTVIIEDYQQDFKTAIGNRLCGDEFQESQKCEKAQTLVVVAASGGGIQASGWTTQILAGLQNEMGREFTKRIGLISSVSGGSVGTMFYLNKFKDGIVDESKQDNQKSNKDKMLENATDDWLTSVGWGLAFPDLFRFIGFPPEAFAKIPYVGNKWPNAQEFKYLDRGYALEKDWLRTLQKEETLDDWYKQAKAGEIPIPVFNSTIVENGRRFLISPLKFSPRKMSDYLEPEKLNDKINNLQQTEKKGQLTIEEINELEELKFIKQSRVFDFRTLYSNCGTSKAPKMCTIDVTTAARLSATFPYVSPSARNYYERENTEERKKYNGDNIIDNNNPQNYHIADGGYFDNAGAFTALEWLNLFLEKNAKDLKITKVLLVQINAFPEDPVKVNQKGDLGLITVLIGPFKALTGVRNSTQISRNIATLELMKKRWNNGTGVDIEGFAITFPKSYQCKNSQGIVEEKDYNQPLSWRLTQEEKESLRKAWETDPEIRTTVEKMQNFFGVKATTKEVSLPSCNR